MEYIERSGLLLGIKQVGVSSTGRPIYAQASYTQRSDLPVRKSYDIGPTTWVLIMTYSANRNSWYIHNHSDYQLFVAFGDKPADATDFTHVMQIHETWNENASGGYVMGPVWALRETGGPTDSVKVTELFTDITKTQTSG